jgi:hypothetical protein
VNSQPTPKPPSNDTSPFQTAPQVQARELDAQQQMPGSKGPRSRATVNHDELMSGTDDPAQPKVMIGRAGTGFSAFRKLPPKPKAVDLPRAESIGSETSLCSYDRENPGAQRADAGETSGNAAQPPIDASAADILLTLHSK